MSKTAFTLVIILAALSVQSCNMVMTGASAVYNRRGLQKTITDQYITMQIFRELKVKRNSFKHANISIATSNGEVLLTGQVANEAQKAKAGKIAMRVQGVRVVYNYLTISNPSSPLTKMSDSWITGKVKAKLIALDDVDASQIKVVTENGTVYLMGVVPPDEAKIASEVASTTDGVQQVIKIFSYVTISKKLGAEQTGIANVQPTDSTPEQTSIASAEVTDLSASEQTNVASVEAPDHPAVEQTNVASAETSDHPAVEQTNVASAETSDHPAA